METFGFRADGGARNKPLHDCSNERAAEADECCEDFGRHVIGGEVSQMANAALTGKLKRSVNLSKCSALCTPGMGVI